MRTIFTLLQELFSSYKFSITGNYHKPHINYITKADI